MRSLKGARTFEDAAKALAKLEARVADGKPAFETRPPSAATEALLHRWRDSLGNRNAVARGRQSLDERGRRDLEILGAREGLTLEL